MVDADHQSPDRPGGEGSDVDMKILRLRKLPLNYSRKGTILPADPIAAGGLTFSPL